MTGNNLHKHYYKIALDGPAASGKSTIAKLIAKRLKFLYIDSGAMYRAVALYLFEKNLLKISKVKLKNCVRKLKIDLKGEASEQKIFLNNRDVTTKIRSLTISNLVSEISSWREVREEMVIRQKKFAVCSSIVMDGRDIGTNVFKEADLKIYLTASPYVRAKRRLKDLIKLREKLLFKDVIRQIYERDNYDSARAISPLCKAQDAIVIDSTDITVEQVLDKINTFLPLN